MLGKILLRLIGTLLVLWSAFVLLRLASPEVRDALQSLPAVAVRYIGLLTGGIGIVLLRRWGLFVYVATVLLQWILYFTLYGGQGAGAPLWLGLLVPAIVVGLGAANWKHLR